MYYINLAVGHCKKPLTVPSETYFNLSTRGCDNMSQILILCIKIACNKTGKIEICFIQAFFIPNSYQPPPYAIHERMTPRSAFIQNKFLYGNFEMLETLTYTYIASICFCDKSSTAHMDIMDRERHYMSTW
jgi:hypothetical protein